MGDFAGTDQVPVSGSEFAYVRLILPALSAYSAIILPVESWMIFSEPPVASDVGPMAPSVAIVVAGGFTKTVNAAECVIEPPTTVTVAM